MKINSKDFRVREGHEVNLKMANEREARVQVEGAISKNSWKNMLRN